MDVRRDRRGLRKAAPLSALLSVSLGDKRCAYDESIRIPLLIRYPKRFPRGGVVDEMVLNIDLARTYLDLAEVGLPPEMQGRRTLPLTPQAKAQTDLRKAFLYQYFMERQYLQTPTMFAVRTETAKLIMYSGRDDWTQVFDLIADPYETTNLAKDPAHSGLRAELERTFKREMEAVEFRLPADSLQR